MFIVFTDGSCNLNKTGANNIGGYAYVILNSFGLRIHEYVGRATRTTNNRMEMMAVIAALKHLKNNDEEIIINSDSQYVINPINQKWLQNWEKNDFKKGKKDILNRDLWMELSALLKPNVKFKWVQGHNGNAHNEYCDKLAATVYQKSFKVIN